LIYRTQRGPVQSEKQFTIFDVFGEWKNAAKLPYEYQKVITKRIIEGTHGI